jgi:hypothetical protein
MKPIVLAKHVYSYKCSSLILPKYFKWEKSLELKNDINGEYVVVCYLERFAYDDKTMKYKHEITYFDALPIDTFTQDKDCFYNRPNNFGVNPYEYLKTTNEEMDNIVIALEKDCEVQCDG